MSRHFRRAAWFAAVILACSVATAARAQSPPLRHVRPVSARLASAIRELERSSTFRDLTARIEASDLIVHLTEVEGGCDGGLKSCTTIVGDHGGYRYLRIQLASMQPSGRLLAQVAHEMQHAVELIGRENVRTTEAMCDGIGWQSQPGHCETRAAREIERQVLVELRRAQ